MDENKNEKRKISKAQQKAVEKYNTANYDRVVLRVKKGEKEEMQRKANEQGKSLNTFINDAIRAAMNK